MAQSKLLNSGKFENFASENKIFIMDTFASETTNEMIGNLADIVMSIEPQPIYQVNGKINSPYELDYATRPVIDVFINSGGGDGFILNSIISLLSIAKSRGAIIRTTVIGRAASCASMLAITGTPGYRIMYDQSYHLVHFGSHNLRATKSDEIDSSAQHIKHMTADKNGLYLKNTNIKPNELKKLQSNEKGYVYSKECLDKGLCDWIIDECGNLTGRQH